MSDSVTALQLLSEQQTYDLKVDVLVALAAATVSDEVATSVAEAIRLQRAGSVDLPADVLAAQTDDAAAAAEVGQAVQDLRPEVTPADSENVSPGGTDISDVDVSGDAAETANEPAVVGTAADEAPQSGEFESANVDVAPAEEPAAADPRDANADGDVQWNEFPK